MSLILVVESEGRHAERVRDGLGSDGWQVEVVSSCEAAVAAVADRAPQLVLINAELPGAPEMLRSLSRAHGGPGSIALLPEVASKELGLLEADESLTKPFNRPKPNPDRFVQQNGFDILNNFLQRSNFILPA